MEMPSSFRELCLRASFILVWILENKSTSKVITFVTQYLIQGKKGEKWKNGNSLK